MYFARLGLTFYNPDGTVAGSGSGYVPCDWVPSGSKAPFKVFASPQASWSRCQISVSWDTSSFVTYSHDFAIINTNAYWSGSLYYEVGEVRNDTPYTWNFVKAVVTIYDTSGWVIDVNWGLRYADEAYARPDGVLQHAVLRPASVDDGQLHRGCGGMEVS
jgi:hypothetical protein